MCVLRVCFIVDGSKWEELGCGYRVSLLPWSHDLTLNTQDETVISSDFVSHCIKLAKHIVTVTCNMNSGLHVEQNSYFYFVIFVHSQDIYLH